MNNIQTLLIEREMTIYRLSQLTGVTWNTLDKVVKSYPIKAHWQTMRKIAVALGVKLDDLETLHVEDLSE